MTCKSYRGNGRICADGFIQRFTCWKDEAPLDLQYLPYCLHDELPEHWLTDAGEPIFYKKDEIAS